ncbi:TPA: lipopolysaccharide biosynthesis protein [Streptococcus suis]
MKLIKGGAAIDSLMLTFVRVITALISIIIYKLLAVNFSLDEYGLYSQVTLVATTMTSITIMGMSDALNYFFNKDLGGETGKQYVRTIIALQCIIGFVGAIGILVFNNQIAGYFKNQEVRGLLIYIAFIPLLTNLLNMFQVMFVSYRKSKIIAARNLTYSILKVLVVAVASYWLKSIKCVLIGSLVIDLLMVGYMVCYCNRNFFKVDIFKANLNLAKEIFFYSLPMAAFIITNSLSRNMDKLVIGWYGDSTELALYTIGAKELPFDMLTASFITVLIPYITRFIANKEYDKAVSVFSKYIQISYVITWLIAGGALVTSKELMLLLYDRKYISALMVFCLYILVDMFRFANTSLVFSAQGRTRELVVYSGSALTLNVILNIVFYKWFGFVGPAVATVLITLVLSIVMLTRSGFLLNSNLLALLNIKQLIVIFLECLVCGFIAFIIKCRLLQNMPTLLVFIVTYMVYGVPLLLMNLKRVIGLFKSINDVKMIN